MTMFKKSPLNLALTIALTTCAVSAQADDKVKELAVTKVQEAKESQYKVAKVATHKITTDLIDTPRSITVVSSDVLADQGVTTFADALRNVSGVSTFGAGEGGGGNITLNDKLTIRGFSANENIYIDGVRDLSSYSRDMFNVEQLEVSKGASSSITGKGTSGGSVNLVTKTAKKDEQFTTIAGFIDESSSGRLTLDTNQQISDTATARINAVLTDGGDYFDNGAENYQTRAIAGSLLLNESDKTDVTVNATLMKQDNTPVLGLPFVTEDVAATAGLSLTEGPIDSSLWDNYYGVESRDKENVDMAQMSVLVDHQLSETTTLRSSTRFGTTEKSSIVTRPRFVEEVIGTEVIDGETVDIEAYTGVIDRSWTQVIDEKNSLFVTQLDLITQFKNDNVTHDVVFGGEYYREKYTEYDTSDNTILATELTPYDAPVVTSFTGSVVNEGDDKRTTGTGIALYALDTISIGEHWLVTAGLRYENYTAETSSAAYWTYIDGVGWTRPTVEGVEAENDLFSYNLSVAYKPTENTNIYFGYANSEDPNGGTLGFTASTAEQLEDASDVDTEEAKSYELGAKWDLMDDALQVNAAVFFTQKKVLDRNDDTRLHFLAGEQEIKGLELGITGEINDDLSIIASYTHLDTEVTETLDIDDLGDGLSAAPEDTASLWLSYAASNKLTVAGGVQYNSGDTYWRRNIAYYETGTTTLLNVMAAYEVNDALTLQLNIDNLTDKEYVTDYSAKGHFTPGNPRNIKLSASYQF